MLASIAAGADPREVDLDEARGRLDTFLASPLTRRGGMDKDQWEWRVAMGLEREE